MQPVVAAHAHVHGEFCARLFCVPCQGAFADIEQKLVNGVVWFNAAQLGKARDLAEAGILPNAYDAAGDTSAHVVCVLRTGHELPCGVGDALLALQSVCEGHGVNFCSSL